MKKASVSFKFINWIKKKSMGFVMLVLIMVYCIISILFGLGYYILAESNNFMIIEMSDEQATSEEIMPEIKSQNGIMDYIYFSFITASTIGYGDCYPTAIGGKILAVIQSIFCAVYIAVMMSILTSKLLWPTKNTIIFSNKILYNPEERYFQVRIINTNSMPIINPEIRIAMTQHGEGDIIAGVLELDNSEAKPIYLGRHDFVVNLGIGKNSELNIYEDTVIMQELRKAIIYQNESNRNDSRFRITITISGSNEVQNIAEIKKYYATDFVIGKGFEAIKYGERDTDKLGIHYKKIPDFWYQFEKIKDETNDLSVIEQ